MAVISDKRIIQQNGSIISYKADVLSEQDYYPFGSPMPGRSYTAPNQTAYRFGFNGKENDNEVKGNGNSIDFGARMYDSRLGRWLSVDPLAHQFPHQSPYSAMDNNPINIIDPTGQSGEPVIDKKNKTITVNQHLIFYGGKAQTQLSNKIASGVAAQWNGAHGRVTVDGVNYKVNFKVTYQTVSEADAKTMATGNTDVKNNFIRVEDGASSSKFQLGGNAGWFNTDDDIGSSTTPAHEIGHGLGLDHTATGGQTEEDVPDIMEARGTQVHSRWSLGGKGNNIDPNFRRVDKKEVEAIFKDVTFDKNGKGEIGRATNKIFTKDGK
jgi:RHS repeat-associated protein